MIPYLCTLALALASSAVLALPAAGAGKSGAGDWQLRAGGALLVQPEYGGGKKLRGLAAPLLEARWRERYFLSTLRGAGYELRLGEHAALSLALAPDGHRRRPKDDPLLRGLAEVKIAPALRLGVELGWGPLFLNTVASTRLGSDKKPGGRGSSVELELGYGLLPGSDLSLAAGVSAVAMDGKLGQALYGVTPAETAATGLRAHRVRAGLQGLGLFAQLGYRFDADWLLFAKAGAISLRGDAAESPIVRRKLQPSLALAVSRSF